MHVRCEIAPVLHYSRDINYPNSSPGTKVTIIRYLPIFHKTPRFHPQILLNRCFQIFWGIVYSIENNAYAFFFPYGRGRRANKVFYGRCANSEYQITDLSFFHSIAKKCIQEGAHPFLLHFMPFSLYFIFLCQKEMHWPGIEPGPPAWQARILPLNHQCLVEYLLLIKQQYLKWLRRLKSFLFPVSCLVFPWRVTAIFSFT